MINRSLNKLALLVIVLICGSSIAASATGKTVKVTDDQIKEAIIQESIASYPGNCPCPYNRAKNGSKCGKRSAYSKPGGYSPICYKYDVTKEMIEAYRAANGL